MPWHPEAGLPGPMQNLLYQIYDALLEHMANENGAKALTVDFYALANSLATETRPENAVKDLLRPHFPADSRDMEYLTNTITAQLVGYAFMHAVNQGQLVIGKPCVHDRPSPVVFPNIPTPEEAHSIKPLKQDVKSFQAGNHTIQEDFCRSTTPYVDAAEFFHHSNYSDPVAFEESNSQSNSNGESVRLLRNSNPISLQDEDEKSGFGAVQSGSTRRVPKLFNSGYNSHSDPSAVRTEENNSQRNSHTESVELRSSDTDAASSEDEEEGSGSGTVRRYQPLANPEADPHYSFRSISQPAAGYKPTGKQLTDSPTTDMSSSDTTGVCQDFKISSFPDPVTVDPEEVNTPEDLNAEWLNLSHSAGLHDRDLMLEVGSEGWSVGDYGSQSSSDGISGSRLTSPLTHADSDFGQALADVKPDEVADPVNLDCDLTTSKLLNPQIPNNDHPHAAQSEEGGDESGQLVLEPPVSEDPARPTSASRSVDSACKERPNAGATEGAPSSDVEGEMGTRPTRTAAKQARQRINEFENDDFVDGENDVKVYQSVDNDESDGNYKDEYAVGEVIHEEEASKPNRFLITWAGYGPHEDRWKDATWLEKHGFLQDWDDLSPNEKQEKFRARNEEAVAKGLTNWPPPKKGIWPRPEQGIPPPPKKGNKGKERAISQAHEENSAESRNSPSTDEGWQCVASTPEASDVGPGSDHDQTPRPSLIPRASGAKIGALGAPKVSRSLSTVSKPSLQARGRGKSGENQQASDSRGQKPSFSPVSAPNKREPSVSKRKSESSTSISQHRVSKTLSQAVPTVRGLVTEQGTDVSRGTARTSSGTGRQRKVPAQITPQAKSSPGAGARGSRANPPATGKMADMRAKCLHPNWAMNRHYFGVWEQLDAREAGVDALQAEVKALQAEVEALQAEVEETGHHLRLKGIEVEGLQRRNSKRFAASLIVSVGRKGSDELNVKIYELERKNSDLSDQIGALEQGSETQKIRIQELTIKVEYWQIEWDKGQENIQRLENENSRQKQENQNMQRELKECRFYE
ncbi:hypothetical protein FB45DRAFT_859254 [Roridomyces roridus]|uniref:Chromo domain-containing protein n=1 Tax=Roridomyces roridus TaxID=1738132 RepID=A0AAD7CJN1_9AGAR|nr:hypothetical protein FB45DRAFT_859254 [Roridomyces roridus]